MPHRRFHSYSPTLPRQSACIDGPTAQHGDWMQEQGNDACTTTGIVFQLTPEPTLIAYGQQREIMMLDFGSKLLNQVIEENPFLSFIPSVPICDGPATTASLFDCSLLLDGYQGLDNLPGENCIGAPAGVDLLTWASPEMSADLLYIMTRTMIENWDEFNAVFPGAPFMGPIWNERVGHMLLPQDWFHPGVRRAYEEFGITYGTVGWEQWISERPDPDKWWAEFLPTE